MSFRVRLIDIGETVSLSPNVCKYELVDDAQTIPPTAILCRIEKVMNHHYSFGYNILKYTSLMIVLIVYVKTNKQNYYLLLN